MRACDLLAGRRLGMRCAHNGMISDTGSSALASLLPFLVKKMDWPNRSTPTPTLSPLLSGKDTSTALDIDPLSPEK